MGIEIILGCLLFSGMVMGTTATVARVITDAFATTRASKAGAWDFLKDDRARRDANWARRRATVGAAWAAARQRRHKQAGGTGEYKPGARAYLGDVYTGWWADRLANRQAKRDHRGPVTWDPNRPPWHRRVDEAVYAGFDRAKAAWDERGNTRAVEPGTTAPLADLLGGATPDPETPPPSPQPPTPQAPEMPNPAPQPTIDPEPAIDLPLDEPSQPSTQGDTTVTTSPVSTSGSATGDAHDVESAIHQCGLLDDDLTAINTALDVIDENIDSAGTAAELIEAFLNSKSVDDSAVGGMSVARDMLSPTHIKALMDAVAAARQGVQSALDELRRLQDLEQQLNGADGSVLNGR